MFKYKMPYKYFYDTWECVKITEGNVKVLEYGHIKPLYAFCRGCGAVLEFSSHETKMTNRCLANGPQDNGRDRFINCPVCGRVIFDGEFKASKDEC